MCISNSASELFDLIESYLRQDLVASELEAKYLTIWRQHRDSNIILSEENQRYIDSVFTALDSYCPDPDLRDKYDLDDKSLFMEIQKLNNAWKMIKE